MASQPQNRSVLLAQFAKCAALSPEAAETAFDVLLTLGYTEEACSNPFLPFATARRLLAAKKKLPATAASALAQHPWDPSEAIELIRLESRKSVLVNMVHSTVLDEDGLDLLLVNREIDGMLAEAALHSQPLSAEYRRRFARHGDFARRLQQLSDEALDDVSFAALKAALLTADEHGRGPHGGLAKLLQEVTYTHPQLLDMLDDGSDVPRRLRSAFASSVHLVEVRHQRALAELDTDAPREDEDLWLLMVLAGNPLVGKDVLTELTASLLTRPVPNMRASDLAKNIQRRLDEERWLEPGTNLSSAKAAKLPWLLRRALPSDYQSGRLYEMLGLTANPNLSDTDAAKLFAELRFRVEDARVSTAVSDLCARFPSLVMQMPAAPDDEPQNQDQPLAVSTRLAALNTRAHLLAVSDDDQKWWLSKMVASAELSWGWAGPVGMLTSSRLAGDRQKWEALLTLLPDFTGTFEELLNSAVML